MNDKDYNGNHINTVTYKPKIRKYNKKLKKINNEETIIEWRLKKNSNKD